MNYKIGTRALAGQASGAVRLGGGSSAGGVPGAGGGSNGLRPDRTHRSQDSVTPDALGIIRRISDEERDSIGLHAGPITLGEAVDLVQRDLLEELNRSDPEPNPHMHTYVSAGFQHDPSQPPNLLDPEHIEAAMKGEGAFIPMPVSLNRMTNWQAGSTEENRNYRKAVRRLNDELVALNNQIARIVEINDMDVSGVQNMLKEMLAVSSGFPDDDEFDAGKLRSNPGESFGAFYDRLVNLKYVESWQTRKGRKDYRYDVSNRMRDLFEKDGSFGISDAIVQGARESMHKYLKDVDLVREPDRDEVKQAVSAALMSNIERVGRYAHQWTKTERDAWNAFIADIRQLAIHEPDKALELLQGEYGLT